MYKTSTSNNLPNVTKRIILDKKIDIVRHRGVPCLNDLIISFSSSCYGTNGLSSVINKKRTHHSGYGFSLREGNLSETRFLEWQNNRFNLHVEENLTSTSNAVRLMKNSAFVSLLMQIVRHMALFTLRGY